MIFQPQSGGSDTAAATETMLMRKKCGSMVFLQSVVCVEIGWHENVKSLTEEYERSIPDGVG